MKATIVEEEAKRRSLQDIEIRAGEKLYGSLLPDRASAVISALGKMSPNENFDFISLILNTPGEDISALASVILNESEQEDTGTPHNPSETQDPEPPANPSELPDSPVHEIGNSVSASPPSTAVELEDTSPPPYSPRQYGGSRNSWTR